MPKSRERISSGAFTSIFTWGTVVLAIALLLAAYMAPRQAPFMVFLLFGLRVVVALAAAAIASGIPGLLSIRWSKAGIRATGAIAVFVVVYYTNPAQLALSERDHIQTVALDLQVADPSGRAIPQATIWIPDAQTRASSDSVGHLTMSIHIPKGLSATRITASAVGFLPTVLDRPIVSGRLEATFVLTPKQ